MHRAAYQSIPGLQRGGNFHRRCLVQVAAGKAAAEQVTTLSMQLSRTRRELEAAATAAEELGRERVINSASCSALLLYSPPKSCRALSPL